MADVGPWTNHRPKGGQLSAQFAGGTALYLSPQKVWLKNELSTAEQQVDKQELKRQWVLTPSTSDLFQAAKTVLLMHARPNKNMKNMSPLESLNTCVSRTPADIVGAMSPTDAEAWVVGTLGLTQFAGRISHNNVDGTRLLCFSKLDFKQRKELFQMSAPRKNGSGASAEDAASTATAAAASSPQPPPTPPLTMPTAMLAVQAAAKLSVVKDVAVLQNALGASISRPADAMLPSFVLTTRNGLSRRCGVRCLLKASLGDLETRPRSVKESLRLLGVEYESRKTPNFSRAEGFTSLPILTRKEKISAAFGMKVFCNAESITAASEHDEESVAAALGGLSKALVLHDDIDGALGACAEWLGVAASSRAQSRALSAFCSLLKYHGNVISTLDLSRATHGHWRAANLAGNVIYRIFEALWMHLDSRTTLTTTFCMPGYCGAKDDDETGVRSLLFTARQPAQLRCIFLNDQFMLEGNVLEALLGDEGIPTLCELRMRGCCRVSGSLPSSIGNSTGLRVLDVRNCSLSGM